MNMNCNYLNQFLKIHCPYCLLWSAHEGVNFHLLDMIVHLPPSLARQRSKITLDIVYIETQYN